MLNTLRNAGFGAVHPARIAATMASSSVSWPRNRRPRAAFVGQYARLAAFRSGGYGQVGSWPGIKIRRWPTRAQPRYAFHASSGGEAA